MESVTININLGGLNYVIVNFQQMNVESQV